MFNAALANVMGIFISPLLLSLMMQTTGKPLPMSELLAILQSLALKMLVPIIIGQILRRFIKPLLTRAKNVLSVISNICILIILFFAFSRTARNPDFLDNLGRMVVPFLYLAAAYIVLLAGAYFGSRLLKMSTENTISVLFAAPQKTLAMGVPLLSTYFAADPEILGIALLPLIFYHPWELFIAGFLPRLVERFKQEAS
jgi:sodium/bile acid cotransporter 7